MTEVVQVRLREVGKTFCFDSTGIRLKTGQTVVVETEYGTDYGEVISEKDTIEQTLEDEKLKKVIRAATKSDLNRIHQNKNRANGVYQTCIKKDRVKKTLT